MRAPTWVRRLWTIGKSTVRGNSPKLPPAADKDLARFFTDAEEARKLFAELLATDAPPKPLLVIDGAGAVGKSSLLRMFRLACHENKTPVALVPFDEIQSAVALVELVNRLVDDLRNSQVDCFLTERSLHRYRRLNTKASGEKSGILKLIGGVVKVGAHLAGGEVADKVADKGVDSVVSVAEALRNGLLSSGEAEFLRDPSRQLREDLLADLKLTKGRLLVLMIDAYEQVGALEPWMAAFASELPAHVLLVLAGRTLPAWDLVWEGWPASAVRLTLVEWTKDNLRLLVRRYYAVISSTDSEPDPKQVEAVVDFAAGVPLAATTVVRLWVLYHVANPGEAQGQVAVNLADRLLENVGPVDRPNFEAAALLRYFDEDTLGAVLPKASHPAEVYKKLSDWPFVRPHRGGLAVHDLMRDVIRAAMRSKAQQHFYDLNKKAAEYYAKRAQSAARDDADRASLELLYHRTQFEEAAAIVDFQTRAEALIRARLVARMRSLMNDVNRYPLQDPSSCLWREYYNARLNHLEGHVAEAEKVYVELGANLAAEPKLRAYALCDLGGILDDFERQSEPGGKDRAHKVITDSLSLQANPDAKLLTNYTSLTNLSNAEGGWDKSLGYLDELRKQLEKRKDTYGLAETHNQISAIHALRGDWGGYLRERAICMDLVKDLPEAAAVRMSILYFNWPLTQMGRYAQAEACATEALELAERVDEREDRIAVLESLALTLGLQDQHDEADKRFAEALAFPSPGGPGSDRYIRATLSFKGLVELHRRDLGAARADLERAKEIKRRIGDTIGQPELDVWLGQLAEQAGDSHAAHRHYVDSLDQQELGRRYFECAALVGLARTGRVLALADAPAWGARARELARTHGYHDLLAALSLDAARATSSTVEFQQALVAAVRYNRFVLDDILSGSAGVVAHCTTAGDAGRVILGELRDWWAVGRVDPETYGSYSTVSEVRDGEALVEAEAKARLREPGNRRSQRTVIEQLGLAIG